MKSLVKNRKGIFGLVEAKQFFTVLLGLALLAFVIIIIMGTLLDANIVTSDLAKNQTTNVLSNVSGGITTFFGSLSSVFTILAVVVIILVLVVLVRVVGGGNGNDGGI